jgi:hypothetical protein
VRTIGNPLSFLLFGVAAICFAAISAGAQGTAAGPVAVAVENKSTPVLCAEEDNVTLTFQSAKVGRFRIEAVHPVYLAALDRDNWEADWTACDFGPKVAPSANGATDAKVLPAPRPPERVTLYETVDRWLVGLRFPEYWRPASAKVRVGEKVHEGLHLLQLWRVRPNGGEEVLVLYPQDGYWRARPKAPKGRELTAFGSSFLVGPVEFQERPIVRLAEVAYREAAGVDTFDLTFAVGGGAVLRIAELSEKQLALDVDLSALIAGKPFAALRSMYVTTFNNDVQKVATRPPGKTGWTEAGIMDFKGGDALEVWAGRQNMSQHNTSSPDMIFKGFGQ